MQDTEVFENFLKRHGDREEKPMPKDLFQIVVFLKKPVTDELNFGKIQKFICGKKIKSNFIFPFYSENIFMFPKEAENFVPNFVKQLIGQQRIPENSIIDHKINYDIIETGIVPLNLVTLEKISEFKDIKLPM
jgi:hypothetical protein